MVSDYRLLAARSQGAVTGEPFVQWLSGDTVMSSFHRTDAGYLVRFPDLADFEISADAEAVACRPAPRVDDATCAHLFLNQVLPLVLSKRGKLVFHGSVVEIGGGAASFLAPSGMGKSTLAAGFAVAGHRFLGDDGFVVERRRGGFAALPSHPSIRLWSDSEAAVLGGEWARAPAVPCTDKNRLLEGGGGRFCPLPLPMRVAYFLGKPTRTAIRFKRLEAREALLQWVRNSFLLDPQERPALATHFERLAELSNRLPCFRLDYPRQFDQLPRVVDAVVAHFDRHSR